MRPSVLSTHVWSLSCASSNSSTDCHAEDSDAQPDTSNPSRITTPSGLMQLNSSIQRLQVKGHPTPRARHVYKKRGSLEALEHGRGRKG